MSCTQSSDVQYASHMIFISLFMKRKHIWQLDIAHETNSNVRKEFENEILPYQWFHWI